MSHVKMKRLERKEALFGFYDEDEEQERRAVKRTTEA